MKFSKIAYYLLPPLLVCTIIIFSIFGRTLNSYFLEDDFGEVLYVSQIFDGHWDKILTNFTSNYMEIPTMKVYRPCLLLSIMADYACWKTNATGYFITNIVFLIGSALILYLVLLELTESWYRPRSLAFALFSAALFAASPLHCESVSLMVGRVDIICAFFYLLSLWCFIRKGNSHNRIITIIGIASFWIALLTKEMAIGLPVLLSAISFLFADDLYKQLKTTGMFATEKYKKTVGQKIGLAFNITYPLWLSCLFYFIIRYLALGTCLGGYVGSIGASQFSHILDKWKDIDTLGRIIIPLNQAVFHQHSIYHLILLSVYFLLLILLVSKLIISGVSRRWLLLLLIWTATVLAPIYQLWGLGTNLEGARFLFFLTIPMAIILPLLIFCPAQIKFLSDQPNHINPSDIGPLEIKVLLPAIIIFSLLIIVDTKIATKNNIPWIRAGQQTKALLEQGQKLALATASDKKNILLGLPKETEGAHIIYNGATFNFIMSPPFAKNYYANKFITFEPISFGNPDLLNTTRLKNELLRTDINGAFLWHKDEMTFEELPFFTTKHSAKHENILKLNLPPLNQDLFSYTSQRGWWQPKNDGLAIQYCQSGTDLITSSLDVDPHIYDFIEIEAASIPAFDGKHIVASWSGGSKEPSTWEQKAIGLPTNSSYSNTEFKTYRIPLSRYWQWFTSQTINNICLKLPAAQSILIRNIRLLSDNSIVPKLYVSDLRPDNTGVYQPNKQKVVLEIDASQIKNIRTVKLEFSKPNYFFENFDSADNQAVLASTILLEPKSKFLLDPNFFSTPGYYQVRAIGQSKDRYEGEWSDPLTLRF